MSEAQQGEPSPKPVDKDERSLETSGWLCAIAALFIPIVGLAGLVIGTILAGKPGRASKGAAIIVLSIVLAAGSSIFWYEHVLHQATSQTTPGVREENGHIVQEVTPQGQEEARRLVEEKRAECAPYCGGENE
jgi:hypothetical protein